MADDPRMGAFLDQWARDQRDGVTIRSVHNRVSGLQSKFDDHTRETRDRLKALETKTEVVEKQHAREELADAIAEGTGRHQVVGTPQAFTPAFGVQVPVELRAVPAEKKRESGFFKSAKKAALSHGGTALGAAVISLTVAWLAGRGCVPEQAVEKLEKPAASAGR